MVLPRSIEPDAKIALFTDVSVNPQQRIGVGACLLLLFSCFDTPSHALDQRELSSQLLYRRFTDTSSTRLELQAALWGVDQFQKQYPAARRGTLLLFTDSQCLAGLAARRPRLEGSHYLATRSGQLLAQAPLYRELYAASDALGFEIVKVAGHARASTRDSIQQIFAMVDQSARRELKLWMKGDDSALFL